MKQSSMPKTISMLLLMACCLFSFNASAHTSRAREIRAVVQSIDYQKSILTLTYAQKEGPWELIWKPHTQFLRNLKPTSVTELKTGTQIVVYYHSPFFGKPFATKVVWSDEMK